MSCSLRSCSTSSFEVDNPGSRFRDAVLAAGADHRPLVGLADYDDRVMQDLLPDRDRHHGIAKLEYDVQTMFVRPVPDQYRALEQAVAELAPDAILAEGAFAGIVPLLTFCSAVLAALLLLPSALRPPPDQQQSSAALNPNAPPDEPTR